MCTEELLSLATQATVDGRVISSDERVKDASQLAVPGPVVSRIRKLYKDLAEKDAALGRRSAAF